MVIWKITKLTVENEVRCPKNWKEYSHDIIGIKFCYPEEWGNPITSPKREITRLKGVVNEFSSEHNTYYNLQFFFY
jgi:hypothetical protein